MTDDNTYTIEKYIELPISFEPDLNTLEPDVKRIDVQKEIELTEKEVRELASQLPNYVLLNMIEPEYNLSDIKEEYLEEDNEQQKVSDCCGAEAVDLCKSLDVIKWYCQSCGEPCDAVDSEDKIEKTNVKHDLLEGSGTWQTHKHFVNASIRRLDNKLQEIIEKINND